MSKEFLYSNNFYEKHAWKRDLLVCGLDEVGRGCLAGPMVSAAVILLPNSKHKLLKDSKELTKQELIKAYNWIIDNSWYSICAISHTDIDKFNIWQSTLMSMRQSCLNLFYKINKEPSIILVDAMPLSLKNTIYQHIEVQSFIKGESHSSSIAAASIIAKVTRDNLMLVYDNLFKGYSFAKHKGYATKVHQLALKNLGISLAHRLSYLKNFELNQTIEVSNEKQKNIFC